MSGRLVPSGVVRRTPLKTFVLLALGCAAAPPPAPQSVAPGVEQARQLPIPEDLRDQIRKSRGIGRQLYMLDKVAAIGTDVLFAHVADIRSQGLGGYLPMQEGDEDGTPKASFLVTFFTAESPPRLKYQIRVAPEVKPTFEVFDPPRPSTPAFAAFVRARQVAIDALPATDQPINPVLIPGEAHGEKGILVYLLAGTKKPNLAVFGRHFRALVPIGGTSVTYLMPLSKSVIEIPTRGPNGEVTEALAITHIVTDYPLETHVFTSLLIKKPVFVGTNRGVWRVDGDDVTLISDKPPTGPR